MPFESMPTFSQKKPSSQERILSPFSAEQRAHIQSRLSVLSLIPQYIGQDFSMPVELNEPGEGWCWDFEKNVVRVDPQDLLEKPMEYLKFLLAHEGAHRRVSRTEFIPQDIWGQPGFAFLMNVVEDPRVNNFTADIDAVFKGHMITAYQIDEDFKKKERSKAQEALGRPPFFMQAGFEYIRQWFREAQGLKFQPNDTLPQEVQQVVQKTLLAARESWLYYPSKQEADSGEEKIVAYAKKSYDINLHQIWPEFHKLVEQDIQEQGIQELLNDFREAKQSEQQKSQDSESGGATAEGKSEGSSEMSQRIFDELTPEQQERIEEMLQDTGDSQRQNGARVAIDMTQIPESIKEALRQAIQNAPQEDREVLEARAEKAVQEFEGRLNEDMKQAAESLARETLGSTKQDDKRSKKMMDAEDAPQPVDFGEVARVLEKQRDVYDQAYAEVAPYIRTLTNDLRNVFRDRRRQRIAAGLRRGRSINISRRIQEIAGGVPAYQSRSFEKKRLPEEKDYAVTLLVDLSGSMQGQKVKETFKATVVFAEVLNSLGIATSVLGFNDEIHTYQAFGERFSKEVTGAMGTMPQEVVSKRARNNDDARALQYASFELSKQEATEQMIIVLSDGLPEVNGSTHQPSRDLHRVVSAITTQEKQKLIGIGLLSDAVAEFYPKHIADVDLSTMVNTVAQVIREAIAPAGH